MPSRILSSSAFTSLCGKAVFEAASAASGETATAAALPTARPSSVRRESGADIELSPVVRAPGGRRVLGPRYRLMQVRQGSVAAINPMTTVWLDRQRQLRL